MPRLLGSGLVVFLLSVVPVVVGVAPARASCASPAPMSSAVKQAAAAFVGRVTDTDWDGRRATVEVDDVWRGDVDSPAVVVGTPGSRRVFSSVDRTYTRGEQYLFLPWRRAQDQWQDNGCSNTQVYGVELDRYRPGGAVRVSATLSPSQLLTAAGGASSPGERSDTVGSRTAGAAAVLAGAAVMAGTTWLAVQRRRRRRAGPTSVREST